MICIKYETIQQPKRSLSLEFELVSTNWSQTRDLEFSLDKTVLYHYFEVSFVCGDFMGTRCIITTFIISCGGMNFLFSFGMLYSS